MLSSDPSDQPAQRHVDRSGEERGAEQDEDVGDDVRSHGCGVAMRHAAADVADYLDWVDGLASLCGNSSRSKSVGLHRPPRVNAMQNHVLVVNSFHECRPVRIMNMSINITAAGIDGA